MRIILKKQYGVIYNDRSHFEFLENLRFFSLVSNFHLTMSNFVRSGRTLNER